MGLRFLGDGEEIQSKHRRKLSLNTSLYILLFILGFFAGGLFVFAHSLKTINQIHKDYREGRYDLEAESGGDEEDEQ